PDVVLLVGRREHLALVDEVDAQLLQHLGLDEVPDPALGHHRDLDRGLDLLDQPRIRHACHPAVAPDCSATRACSAVITSMMTPPFSISARPTLRRNCSCWFTRALLSAPSRAGPAGRRR